MPFLPPNQQRAIKHVLLLYVCKYYSHRVSRGIMCTDELEAVAEVEAPDAYTLVSGPSRYDSHI